MIEEIPAFIEERIELKTPEAELWRAVIDQAIDDLSDPDLSEAAVEWFTSVSEQPCSFRWVCEQLNLSSSAVWSALARRNAKLLAPPVRPKLDGHRSRLRSMYSRREIAARL